MLQLISRHRVFAAYLLSLLWLALSAWAYASYARREATIALLVLGLVLGVTLVYAGALRAVRHSPLAAVGGPAEAAGPYQLARWQDLLLLALVGAYALVAFSHFAIIGFVPAVEGLRTTSDLGVSVVRARGYYELPGFMRYASDYSVKALGPALLLVTYYVRSRLFWAVLAIAVLYTTGLFVRILPIVLFAPLLLYVLMKRRWLHAAGLVCVLCVQLVLLTAIASNTIRTALADRVQAAGNQASAVVAWVDELLPERDPAGQASAPGAAEPGTPAPGAAAPRLRRDGARPAAPVVIMPPPPGPPDDWRRTSVAYAFYERMLIVPGQVIDQWFQYYKEPERREGGCGYRMLAPLAGCAYVPIPSKLYEAFYKDNVDQGMRGSLNAAWFMTEFANFGPAGFILSSLIGGLLFAVVMLIYRDHPLALPMNLPLIVTAMESSLPTAINSGSGWLVMTAIFVLFFRFRKP